MRKRLFALVITSGLVLAGCSSEDPIGSGSGADGDTIVIGTANFPESEILGQVWAAALEKQGFKVEVKSGIGSREVYMSALKDGSIDLVPEYTGNLAQFFDAEVASGSSADDVYNTLVDALPDGLKTAAYAPAESKDSYNVTKKFAQQHSLTTIADLKNAGDLVLAGNPELEQRPYGPKGLESTYKISADKVTFQPILDGGGPLTIAALISGAADVADIYTTAPHLDSSGNEVDLVTLEDPENLVPAQNVVPVYRDSKLSEEAIRALDDIDAKLTTEDLIHMNKRNVGNEKVDPAAIAKEYVD